MDQSAIFQNVERQEKCAEIYVFLLKEKEDMLPSDRDEGIVLQNSDFSQEFVWRH